MNNCSTFYADAVEEIVHALDFEAPHLTLFTSGRFVPTLVLVHADSWESRLPQGATHVLVARSYVFVRIGTRTVAAATHAPNDEINYMETMNSDGPLMRKLRAAFAGGQVPPALVCTNSDAAAADIDAYVRANFVAVLENPKTMRNGIFIITP